ncbi:hypothetical protein TWF718_005849 [Orbilia javanica]|uniref:Nucleoside phosphorylase domain-containing protein n=1 Tax=Orbilia javanica TaxID=47235 RepID=A0AAN8N469_9PEZI
MSKRNREGDDNLDWGIGPNCWPTQKRQRDIGSQEDVEPLITRTAARTSMLPCDHYTVGWICALPLEMAAAVAMLDEIHDSQDLEKHPNDNNAYTLGDIGDHNIAIACLPFGVYGTTSAATVASQMASTFKSITTWLMVGIGGGVPDAKNDIRLGDIVVSKTVIQYDYGKTIAAGCFERTSVLMKPSQALLTAVSRLEADCEIARSRIPTFLSEMLARNPYMRQKYAYQGQEHDVLFEAEYDHTSSQDTCDLCHKERVVARPPRPDTIPVVHYGPIASGNQVMKHGKTRDRIKQELGILCFEMEAAGLMDSFSCLVIRGICDYSDSHKNKRWQQYSAATAAAYTKELLCTMPAERKNAKKEITEKRRNLTEALNFSQLDSRQATIKAAHVTTCQWLLTKPEYQNWLDKDQISKHHGFLWIKGKPGTGKSTIMKFALKHCQDTIPETHIISFFFNARGTDLEKSTVGMYRSLLYQLLKKVPRLWSVFDSVIEPPPPKVINDEFWDIELLQNTLNCALGRFGRGCLICFIDALDECEEEQIRNMLSFFDSLGTLAVSKGTRLHVCFSSRHYPHITIRKGQEMVLEGQEGHDHDIASYLNSELKAGDSKQVAEIKTEILEKASGIFLWVVLAVKILNQEYDRGRLHALRKRLKEIPRGLSDLFKDILTRDAENMESLLLCIEWVLYAKRPLELEELYFAILSSESPEDLGAWDHQETTTDDMRRFILSASKGLVEATKSQCQTFQFIHESVRDFLLREGGLSQLWSKFGSQNSHERLKQGCFNYLKMDGSLDLGTKVDFQPTYPSKSRDFVLRKFPFLKYAVQHVLYHANLASDGGTPQENFINIEFRIENWVILNNLLEPSPTKHHNTIGGLLFVVAVNGLLNLVKIALRRENNIDIIGGRYSNLILETLRSGHENVAREILRPDANCLQKIAVPEDQYRQALEDLLHEGRSLRIGSQTLLSYAAENGKWGWVEVLLATGKVDADSGRMYHIDSGWDIRSPLSYAAEYGNFRAAKLFLDMGAEVDGGYTSQTPLAHAASAGHEAIVRLLLERGAEVDGGHTSQTPLVYAASSRHKAIIDLLLERGAKTEVTGGDSALLYAVRARRLDITQALLQNGANPNYLDTHGQSPLWYAALNNSQKIAKILLEHGADVDFKNSSGTTPLMAAVAMNYHETVKQILNGGADPLLTDSLGETALSIATDRGNIELVNLLSEHSKTQFAAEVLASIALS